MDTHVYQIAVKHYGLKGTPGKGTMSPKLYEAVNSKLANIWGAYAGWAHSASTQFHLYLLNKAHGKLLGSIYGGLEVVLHFRPTFSFALRVA